jgi:hypothetical protein
MPALVAKVGDSQGGVPPAELEGETQTSRPCLAARMCGSTVRLMRWVPIPLTPPAGRTAPA